MKLRRLQPGLYQAADDSFRFARQEASGKWHAYPRDPAGKDGFADEPAPLFGFGSLRDAVWYVDDGRRRTIAATNPLPFDRRPDRSNGSLVLAEVTRRPGCTGAELWHEAPTSYRVALGDHHEQYRRLSDLRHAGKVRQGAKRRCRLKGVEMVTWEPAVPAAAADVPARAAA